MVLDLLLKRNVIGSESTQSHFNRLFHRFARRDDNIYCNTYLETLYEFCCEPAERLYRSAGQVAGSQKWHHSIPIKIVFAMRNTLQNLAS